MKTWPALDVRFRNEEALVSDLEGYFAAFLDDYSPNAIVDTSGAKGLTWRIFFTSVDARASAAAAIAAQWHNLDVAAVDVPDEQWAEKSQAGLTAVQVGRIIVTPPWDLPRARSLSDAASTLVVIEPSMGFGTGHHESTRLCLAALQQIDVLGRRVLDLGTGSGVLAIASVLIGGASGIALDDDGDAVIAAEQNVALNQVADRVEVRQSDFTERPPVEADVVLANLTGALLRRHAGRVKACVAPTGTLILGGFTEDERLAVVHAFEPFAVVREDAENGWIALTLERRGPIVRWGR